MQLIFVDGSKLTTADGIAIYGLSDFNDTDYW